MSERIQVVGQVISGRGLGRHRVFRYRDQLRAIVKQSLYPGTLNVVLNLPLRLLDSAGSTFDCEGGMVWPATFCGIDVWMYRWPECPVHVVEIVSSVCLRERFDLKDGDDVTLGLNKELTGAIDILGRLAWAALWIGKRDSFFLRDTCHSGQNRTMLWSRKLGALQQPPEIKGVREVSLLLAKKLIRGPAALSALMVGWLKI